MSDLHGELAQTRMGLRHWKGIADKAEEKITQLEQEVKELEDYLDTCEDELDCKWREDFKIWKEAQG